MSSFVRPGCTHVTVVAKLRPAEREALHRLGAEGVALKLLHLGGWLGEDLAPLPPPAPAGGGPQGEAWAADMLVSRWLVLWQCACF